MNIKDNGSYPHGDKNNQGYTLDEKAEINKVSNENKTNLLVLPVKINSGRLTRETRELRNYKPPGQR